MTPLDIFALVILAVLVLSCRGGVGRSGHVAGADCTPTSASTSRRDFGLWLVGSYHARPAVAAGLHLGVHRSPLARARAWC